MSIEFPKYVSLQQVKNRLRIDTDDEDSDLLDLIEQCTAVIIAYLKVPNAYLDTSGLVPTDTSGDPIGVPREVQLATLVLIGIMYRDRDGADMEAWQQGYLPWQVTSLIYHLRDPALA